MSPACCEMEEISRENIREITGRAGAHDSVNFSDSVALVAIEGAEFGVVTLDCVAHMKSPHVILELHDFLMRDGRRLH